MANSTDSLETVMQAAEEAFFSRGYKSVTLAEIADNLGINKASLYYHAPKGKEQLYVMSVERCFRRHHAAIDELVSLHLEENGVEKTLIEIGLWFAKESPLNCSRMLSSDLPLLKKNTAKKIYALLEEHIASPLRVVFDRAERIGVLRAPKDHLLGLYLNLMESIHNSRLYTEEPIESVLKLMLDVYFHGALSKS